MLILLTYLYSYFSFLIPYPAFFEVSKRKSKFSFNWNLIITKLPLSRKSWC